MKKELGFALLLCGMLSVSALAQDATQEQLNASTEAYEESYVLIDAGDHEIPAIVGMPTGEVRGGVVMLHGTGSTKNEAGDGYKVACPILGEEYGLATIRIDFMGNGDSTADYVNYNFATAVADAMAARDYLAGLLPEGTGFGVMGWSQGGTDALLAAGENPDSFGSIVTWAGAPDMNDMLSEEDYEMAKTEGYFVMPFDWRDELHVGLQWCEDVKNVDVLEVFSAFAGPVLAIAGEEDTAVDPEWANRIVEASTNEASKTYFIPGMDHTFNVFSGEDFASLKDAAAATGAFFAETLAAE